MRPFGCHVTILNIIDHLGKFDGKANEGFFVGYSTNNKAFWVFNNRTGIVEENLDVKFSEDTPNIARNGPNWLFDIDALTKSMNYELVVAGNQSNGIADLPFSSSLKDSPDAGFKPIGEEEKKSVEHPENEDCEVPNKKEPRVNQEKDESVNIYGCVDDPNMPNLEEIVYSDDDEDVDAEADMTNLDTHILIEAIQDELLQFKLQKIWTLVDLPYGKRAIRTKWIYRNKKDERVARIEAIRLFLAYASFKDFVVYQIDVKSAFRYGKIKEEVCVCQPLGFEDPEKLTVVIVKTVVDEILKKFGFSTIKTTSTPMETSKSLMKDDNAEDVDYPKDSPFDLEAYTDSDYAGASLDRKSITGVKNLVFHSKTKHIEIRHHFIRDSYEKRLIQVIKIHTDHNVADLLTKAFDIDDWNGLEMLRMKLGLKLCCQAKVNAARLLTTARLPLELQLLRVFLVYKRNTSLIDGYGVLWDIIERMTAIKKRKKRALADLRYRALKGKPLKKSEVTQMMRNFVKNQWCAAHNGTITMKDVKAMHQKQLVEEYEYICRRLEKDRLLSAQYNLFRPKPAITEPPSKRQRVERASSQPASVPAITTHTADDPDSAGGGSSNPAGSATPMAGSAASNTAGGTFDATGIDSTVTTTAAMDSAGSRREIGVSPFADSAASSSPSNVSIDHIPIDVLFESTSGGILEFFRDSDEDEQIGMSRVVADPDSDDEVFAEIIFRGKSISGDGVVFVDQLPDDEIVDPRVKVETITESAASPPRSRRKHLGVRSDDFLWDKPVEDFFSSESESDDDMENYIPPLPYGGFKDWEIVSCPLRNISYHVYHQENRRRKCFTYLKELLPHVYREDLLLLRRRMNRFLIHQQSTGAAVPLTCYFILLSCSSSSCCSFDAAFWMLLLRFLRLFIVAGYLMYRLVFAMLLILTSTITTQQPTEGELDLLFEAMYDDHIGGQPSAAPRTITTAQAPQVLHTPTASTTTTNTTPTPTNLSSQATNFPNTSQDVDELETQQHVQHQPATIADNVPNATFDENTFVNPFATPSTSAAESSTS
ncbi:putative ribonuclease H-like domain-containing protein [Tanacetum coccineum]